MKKLFIFCCCFFTAGLFWNKLKAQDPELVQRLQGKTTLKTIMKEVDEFYQSKGLEKNRGNGEGKDDDYARWKRWEWYMRDRLGPNGEFVDINQKMKEAFDFRNSRDAQNPSLNRTNNADNVSSGSWSFVGPNSFGTVWGSLGGNGRVDRIAFHPTIPTTIFAATPGGGFWKSTTGGTSWTNLSNFSPTMGISGIVIDRVSPSIIYLLTGTGDDYKPGYFVYDFGYSRASVGVLKSTDGGVNWTTTGDLYTGGPYAGYKLVQDPRNTSILLAATNQGLYRTANGGNSWTQVLSGSYTDVEFNPLSSIASNSAYATGPGKYYYSNNEGTNWTAGSFDVALNGSGRNAIAVTAADTSKVYVLAGPVTAVSCSPVNTPGFWGIYRSLNGGKNFTRGKHLPNILGGDDAGNDCGDQSGYDLAITASPTNANFIATSGMTVWVSNDGGVTNLSHVTYYWGGPVSTVHPDTHGVDYNPLDGNLYASTDGGLYVSSDNGTTWTNLSNGINATQWYHFTGFPNDNTHLNGGLQDNGIRNRTTFTTAFNHVASGDGFDCAYDPNNSSRFYSIINSGGNLYTLDGAHFVYGSDFTNYFPKIGRHPTTTNTLWVGREDLIYTSSNEGSTFSSIGSVGGNRRIVFCPSLTSTIYVANSSKVWRNTSSGTGAWTDLSLSTGWPAGSPTVTCVAVNPGNSNIVCVTFGGFTAGAKVLYSSSGGASWSNESNSLPNLPVNCAAFGSNNSIYIGTDDGVYYQSPSDVDWLPFYNGLPRVPVTDLYLFETISAIYASTFGRGIYTSTMKEACDVNLTLSGTVGGQFFNQASGNITSTQVLTGGEGTTVYNRAGSNIVLSPGFEAKAGNEYKAYIGPCDQHGVPVFRNAGMANSRTDIDIPNYILPYDEAKKTNLPFGYLEVIQVGPSSGVIKMRAKEKGDYILRIVNRRRETIKEVFHKNESIGEQVIRLSYPALAAGSYYIEMWYGDKLAHFQEWNIN